MTIAKRNAMMLKYAYIVEIVARKLWRRYPQSTRDDLIQYGFIGLMQAIKAFDPTRGWKFETFCPLRIKGAMIDGIRAEDWVPRGARERYAADGLDLPDVEMRGEWGDIACYDDPTMEACRNDIKASLTRHLTPMEKTLFLAYYYEGANCDEIGHRLNVCGSRVSQIRSNIVERIRATLSPDDIRLEVA